MAFSDACVNEKEIITFVVGAKNVEKPCSVFGAKIGVLVGSHTPSGAGNDVDVDDVVSSESLDDCVLVTDVADDNVETVPSEELIGSNKLSQLLRINVRARGNKTVHVFFILNYYTKSLQLKKGEH
jgi:hypothetical protein